MARELQLLRDARAGKDQSNFRLEDIEWAIREVNAKLNDITTRAFGETWATHERTGASMRMSAYGVAVKRVSEATTIRGLYP